jgi:hypothetical protein
VARLKVVVIVICFRKYFREWCWREWVKRAALRGEVLTMPIDGIEVEMKEIRDDF